MFGLQNCKVYFVACIWIGDRLVLSKNKYISHVGIQQ